MEKLHASRRAGRATGRVVAMLLTASIAVSLVPVQARADVAATSVTEARPNSAM